MAEWKIFRQILFTNYRESSCSDVLAHLLTNHTLKAGFPNLESLASICVILPVTTATVKRSFSDMKLVKTRLRSRLSEDTLDQAMQVCIEGPEKLSYGELETIVEHWKNKKKRRLNFLHTVTSFFAQTPQLPPQIFWIDDVIIKKL